MKDGTSDFQKAFFDKQVEEMATKLTGMSSAEAKDIAEIIIDEMLCSGKMIRALEYVEEALPLFLAQFHPDSANTRMVSLLLKIISDAKKDGRDQT